MEAVGAAAAILQLAEMAISAISTVYKTIGDVKNAHKEEMRFTREMRELTRILDQLLLVVVPDEDSKDNTPPKHHMAAILELLHQDDNPVSACTEEIAKISNILAGSRVSWPLRKREVERRLEKITRYKNQLGFALQTQTMAELLVVESLIKAQSRVLNASVQEESQRAALAWLQATDARQSLMGALEKRQAGTAEWFLQSNAFRDWRSSPQFLWITGIPGAGKTVLSSVIISSLLYAEKHSDTAVIYSYFDFQVEAKQKPEALLRTLLGQLSLKKQEAFQELRNLHQDCQGGQEQPTGEELLRTVKLALSHFPKVHVVVDALDECSDRQRAVRYLKEIYDCPDVHLIVLSRKQEDIRHLLLPVISDSISLEGPHVDADIATYIRHRVAESEYMKEWPPEEHDKVEKRLNQMAGGMFRWVQCQLDTLEQLTDSAQIDQALLSLPEDLPETYERILSSMDSLQIGNVRRLLTCLAFSLRPLSMTEIANALQIDPAGEVKISSKTVFWRRLINACSSLVTEYGDFRQSMEKSAIPEIRLAHFSVKEYLVSSVILESPAKAFALSPLEGMRSMAEICVACLVHFDNVHTFGPDNVAKFPFAIYAARNWHLHAIEVNEYEERGKLDDLIMQLFNGKPGIYVNWYRIVHPLHPDRQMEWNINRDGGKLLTKQDLLNRHTLHKPLFYAARWSFWRVAKRLIEAGHNPNDWNSGNHTAMHEAAIHGTRQCFEVLQAGGGDPNARNWTGATPLHCCVIERRDPAMTDFLIRRGASPNTACEFHGAVMHAAAYDSTPEVVKALLQNKAHPDIIWDHYHGETVWIATALQGAAYVGKVESIDLLLQYGARINHAEGKTGTALHAAALGGQLEAVKRLLEKGADVHKKAGTYGEVLSAAGYGASKAVMETLLDHGAVSTELTGPAAKPWSESNTSEREALVNAIIATAAEKHCPDLLQAAKRGTTSMVLHYLRQGADLGQKEKIELRSPLNWAALNGHLESVRALVEAKANIEAWSRMVESPLMAACGNGHMDVVKYLLAHGANPHHLNSSGNSCIARAQMSGHAELAEFLRELAHDRKKSFEFEGKVYGYDEGRKRYGLI